MHFETGKSAVDARLLKFLLTVLCRVFQDRLDKLDEEEAMLTDEIPTHPEYLSMMECVDARRDERLRIAEVEYQMKMDVLNRRAVAERAQIMSQFYQSIRESREKMLEELGRQWYEIQHERRRYTNSIPDYTLWFPSTKAKTSKTPLPITGRCQYCRAWPSTLDFPRHQR